MSTERFVEKCPACGTLRNSSDAKCPACGYEFTDSGTTVISKLNDELTKIGYFSVEKPEGYDRQIKTLIESFHIPQVKREVLDLLLFLQPKAIDENSPYSPYWLKRQREVIERAKMMFSSSSDKDIQKKIQEYEQDILIAEKRQRKNFWQRLPMILKIVIVIIFLLLILILIPAKDVSPEAYSVRFSEAVEDAKWDKAMKYLQKCPEMGYAISDWYLSLIDGLIADDRVVEAGNLLSDLHSYVSTTTAKDHISSTSKALLLKLISIGRIDEAKKYAIDADGVTEILKAYISNGQDSAAIEYYKSKKSTLHKYDFDLHKNVFLCDDETVIEFLNTNGIKTD